MIPGPLGVLEDRNNDGIPDAINARIYVADEPTPEELAAAANIAARLAFETLAMDLPLGFRISEYDDADSTVAIIVGSAARTVARTIDGARKVIAFPNPNDANRFARTLGEETEFPIRQLENQNIPRSISLAHLFSSEGLLDDIDGDLIPDRVNTTVILGPDVRTPRVIDFAARLALETTGLRLPLVFSSRQDVDLQNATLIGLSNPHVQRLIAGKQFRPDLEAGQGQIEVVANALIIVGADAEGEAAALEHAARRLSHVREDERSEQALAPPVPMTSLTIDLPWEVDEARERISRIVMPAIREGSTVDVELLVSEPSDIRTKLAEDLRREAIRRGADPERTRVRVLCAYKQGFSWIDETLKPLAGKAANLQIFFRETEATGLQPIESPFRWLHELYPIDEILSRDLGIPIDRITFEKQSETAHHTYRVIARDSSNGLVFDESFDPLFVFRPLFDKFPEYANVRVTTGWLKADVDGAIVADERIVTDPEKLWDTFQSKVLSGVLCDERKPGFPTLEVEVWASEPDYRVGIDEECVSSLEALHEDIYFETLLFLDLVGSPPVRVIPRIHPRRPGQGPRLRATISSASLPAPQPHPQPAAITVRDGLSAKAAPTLKDKPSPSPASVVQWDTPIDPEECEALVAHLNRFPEVRAFRAGASYLGRTIWAMDVTAPLTGEYVSRAKASVTKPTLFITGRQHANEVSSTSHILRLVELLVTDPECRKLLDRVNVVVQPITNPDGAALACELHKSTPDFMLHAGYYGALGVDVTRMEWDEKPIYPEARARRELWQLCLPDVVLNPHGYPSHEWVQLFAGYTAWVQSRSVTARDWWIPRGWFIPQFAYIDDPQYPEHRSTALAIRQRLIEASSRTMRSINERMLRRYAKYNAFESAACSSPAPVGVKPRSDAPGFMRRHPNVTVLECVTEAPDETAHGDWMKLVAQAGLDCGQAVIRFLAESRYEVKREVQHYENATVLRISRKRPVMAPEIS